MIAVDYRGYGLSTGRPTEQGIYRDVDALLARAWPDAEEARSSPLVYWGRSLGGAIAAYGATRGFAIFFFFFFFFFFF